MAREQFTEFHTVIELFLFNLSYHKELACPVLSGLLVAPAPAPIVYLVNHSVKFNFLLHPP